LRRKEKWHDLPGDHFARHSRTKESYKVLEVEVVSNDGKPVEYSAHYTNREAGETLFIGKKVSGPPVIMVGSRYADLQLEDLTPEQRAGLETKFGLRIEERLSGEEINQIAEDKVLFWLREGLWG
jgi:hypothetical protein